MAAYSGPPDAVDFSFSRVSGATLAARGIKLAARYLSHTPAKNLSASEAQDLLSHGVAVLLNWESSTGRVLFGADAGTPDGRDACALADQIGAPHGSVIYYSADEDVPSNDYGQVYDYLVAARSATSGRFGVGIYGKYDLIEYLNARGFTHDWQTYAWSGGKLSAATDLYQYLNGQSMAGASVDYDHIIHAAELGAWWPAGHAPAGSGTPLEEVSMSAADVAALSAKIDDLATLLLYGDGPDVPDSKNTHADNIRRTRKDIGVLAAVLGLITNGDGPDVDVSVDTHGNSLKAIRAAQRVADAKLTAAPATITAAVVAAVPGSNPDVVIAAVREAIAALSITGTITGKVA